MPPRLNLSSIEQIFGLWPTQVEMARVVGVEWQTCAKWSQRKRIPPESWDAVIAAVRRKGYRLTEAQLNKWNKPRGTARHVVVSESESSRA